MRQQSGRSPGTGPLHFAAQFRHGIEPGALAILIAFLNQHPEAGAVGARLLTVTDLCSFSASRADARPRVVVSAASGTGFIPGPSIRCPPGRLINRSVEILKGACIFAAAHGAGREIGFTRRRFFMYSEEVDLCKRVEQAGWSCIGSRVPLSSIMGPQYAAGAAGDVYATVPE